MTKQELFIGGERLRLAKHIGKGGEGDVYLLDNEIRKAVKIYKEIKRQAREEKVRAMVQLELAKRAESIAFPLRVVTTASGEFAGFEMRLIEGSRPIHELYGPKSRKAHFPQADYQFLVRAAENVARVVGQAHSLSCVIGDVNHSGILVSALATASLIDADSFQVQLAGRTYPCMVGVPEFTPPELQGLSLAGRTRKREHDFFGLAVAIFQLLVMGRHPYAGQQENTNLTLEQLIAHNLFAYSRTIRKDISPPGVVAKLDDFPPDIADAFERAFGLEPARRPGPSEWVELLGTLGKKLVRCSMNAAHLYPEPAKNCPWCRMEGASGVLLFLAPSIGSVAPERLVDIGKAMAFVQSVVIPEPKALEPRLPIFRLEPSDQAIAAKASREKRWLYLAAVVLVIVASWPALPRTFAPWLCLVAVALAWWQIRPNKQVDVLRVRHAAEEKQWLIQLEAWRNKLNIPALAMKKEQLSRSSGSYCDLLASRVAELSKCKSEAEERQRRQFLDRFLIAPGIVPGIKQARVSWLLSFGVESAADITWESIVRIPRFGPALANALLIWRASHERHFVFNPNLPADNQAIANIHFKYASKLAGLSRQVESEVALLGEAYSKLKWQLEVEDTELVKVAMSKAQLETDLIYLGLEVSRR